MKGLEDLASVCREGVDKVFYGVRFIRSRPYSRIAALVFKSCGLPTITEILESKEPREIYEYLVQHGITSPGYITIYRGGSDIRPGDWVAIEYDYASEYGKVYEKRVSTDDVIWAGTYEKEFYYVPKEMRCRWKGIEDFCNDVLNDPPEEKEGGRLKWMEEHFEEYLITKIIDAVVTVIVTFMIVKMFEPYLTQSTLAAQASIQALLKRV